MERRILHVDMDSFYASVEIRDNPSLAGKPVVISGPPNSRSVVSAASYPARKFGIRSAMSASQAKKLCPEAIFIYPNFEKYKLVSKQIREIFYSLTPIVETMSLDEAYLDVSHIVSETKTATQIAEQIRKDVFETTKCTCSVGVSYNKFLAKMASDWNKPNGIFVVRPKDAESFLDKVAIGKFHGIGKKTEAKFQTLGVQTGKDLRNLSHEFLTSQFGKMGTYYYEIVRGIDNREVETFRIRKSLGIEDTFLEDSNEESFLFQKLEELAKGLELRLAKREAKGRTLTVKIKYSDFTQTTSSKTFPKYISSKQEIFSLSKELFQENWKAPSKVRLLGISLSHLNLEKENMLETEQSLFESIET